MRLFDSYGFRVGVALGYGGIALRLFTHVPLLVWLLPWAVGVLVAVVHTARVYYFDWIKPR